MCGVDDLVCATGLSIMIIDSREFPQDAEDKALTVGMDVQFRFFNGQDNGLTTFWLPDLINICNSENTILRCIP